MDEVDGDNGWISIHAHREEGDGGVCFGGGDSKYFYPRPPRGGRRGIMPETAAEQKISIHALREEGDGS